MWRHGRDLCRRIETHRSTVTTLVECNGRRGTEESAELPQVPTLSRHLGPRLSPGVSGLRHQIETDAEPGREGEHRPPLPQLRAQPQGHVKRPPSYVSAAGVSAAPAE